MIRICVLTLFGFLAACGRPEPLETGEQAARFVALNDIEMSPKDPAGHACTRDTHTGLVWEGKSDVDGLHNWRNTYSWFDPNEAHDELDYRGVANAGVCDIGYCDTWSFVIAVNKEGFCGFDDWRIPSRDEMFSISDIRQAKKPPTIDTEFFPLTQPAEYWSVNDYSFEPTSAWAWSYQHGHDRVDWKRTPKFVRLVRGVATELAQVKE